MADYTKAPADPETQAKRDAEAYLLFEAPIAELAGARGVSIDEAVKERVAAAIEAAPIMLVSHDSLSAVSVDNQSTIIRWGVI